MHIAGRVDLLRTDAVTGILEIHWSEVVQTWK